MDKGCQVQVNWQRRVQSHIVSNAAKLLLSSKTLFQINHERKYWVQVVVIAGQAPVNVDLRPEIAYNLAILLRSSGADELAKEVMVKHLTI